MMITGFYYQYCLQNKISENLKSGPREFRHLLFTNNFSVTILKISLILFSIVSAFVCLSSVSMRNWKVSKSKSIKVVKKSEPLQFLFPFISNIEFYHNS